MIKKIIVKGFRILRNFSWKPKEDINVLVGDNASGKSTILDAIELAMSCRINGRRATEELSPFWFNADDVREFFESLNERGTPQEPPRILIELQLDETDPTIGRLQGLNNSEWADCPGLKLEISVESDLLGEFYSVVRSETADIPLLPVEYYSVKWNTFQGSPIGRAPDGLLCARISTGVEGSARTIDYFARSVVSENLSADDMRKISSRYRTLRQEIDSMLPSISEASSMGEHLKGIGLQMDQSSKTDWKNGITLQNENLPLSQAGRGIQIEARTYLALQNSTDKKVLLMEEPENHLSHTTLTRLMGSIRDNLKGRQLFVTTHSAFVLNRLGLDRLALMSDGKGPACIVDLSPETVRYFQKQSGVDTLRIALATRAVLVEGPSDEMVFNWAYRKKTGREPREDGIDVIAYGVRGKRALELAKSLDRGEMAVLRDNDGKEPSEWKADALTFLKNGKREMFIGETSEGETLEPQMVKVNLQSIDLLQQVLCIQAVDDRELTAKMKAEKTEWAWRLASKDPNETEALAAPKYIEEAIDFIAPKTV